MATATSLGLILQAIGMYWMANRFQVLEFDWGGIGKHFLVVAVSAMACLFVWRDNDLGSVIVAIIVFLAVYLLMARIIRAWDTKDRVVGREVLLQGSRVLRVFYNKFF